MQHMNVNMEKKLDGNYIRMLHAVFELILEEAIDKIATVRILTSDLLNYPSKIKKDMRGTAREARTDS